MAIMEDISMAADYAMSKAFGDGEIREVNMKLARNISLFGSAIIFFKIYGQSFDV
ncbi:unnamed protein product [Chondrus crispus]|uniref:Uncharacterized protein n=1 Tax=Chondrus crispus TaxID=2769 RepID=R7QHV6_CHOCR|nr:unnamed protein product [Chondrus crispus]CDF36980.1 unnamed protein product [Chondrus crispus]|eukprot:XP_005716799.1 unnamed protein product [Chondrus crispus]